ncbi:branched chain amino acid ABC transporter substrate-binding protein [Spirochaetia bacterium]|nr:branched chain amino acid ABC transporter substrate-binding protein [Spirochaetia bacterium]
MKVRKIVTLFLVVTLLTSVVFLGCSKKTSSGETIKIGMIFPLSGGSADQGVFNRYGGELAVEKINAAGGIKALGGRKLEVVFYDNKSSSDESRAAAERLLAEHPDIVAASGAGSSGWVLPLLPTFEKAQVSFLSAQTSETLTSQGYKYVFIFGCQATQFSGGQIEMIKWLNETYKLGISKVGLIYEDTEVGSVNSQATRNLIKGAPELTIAYDMKFQPNASDLSSIVLGLMNAGCEVVFPTAYTQDAKLFYNTMKQYNYAPIVIGAGAGFLYPAFSQDLGDLVDGLLSTATHSNDIKSIGKIPQFAKIGDEYEAKFKEFMPEQAVSAFNAVYIISQALEKCASTDPKVVAETIRGLQIDSLAPGGPLNFKENGWNQSAVSVMVQWMKDKDGIYRPHTVFPASEAAVEFQLSDMLKAKIKN